MTDKAFITKRGARRDEATFAFESEAAQKHGFIPLTAYDHGTIIGGGTPDQYKKLEEEGYRVKVVPKAEILHFSKYYINTEKGLPDIPSELKIPESLRGS